MLWLALACAGTEPERPACDDVGEVAATVAPAGVSYDAVADGDALGYGTPPQGGSPYSPFHVRTTGLAALGEGASVRLVAQDLDGDVVLGDTTYELRLVCANVGDDAGSWVGSDLHQRFDGYDLDGLEGREVRITATVADLAGGSVSDSLIGVLTRM
ncbi:MAG: hypothetical protein EXR71_19465 [Myxococcales bacterium]|nr:hypothetical protein [Myxococcales bacterium]